MLTNAAIAPAPDTDGVPVAVDARMKIAAMHVAIAEFEKSAADFEARARRGARNPNHADYLNRMNRGYRSAARHGQLLLAHLSKTSTPHAS